MKGMDIITGSTDKESQRQTSQSHEENCPSPMAPTLDARGCPMPMGPAKMSVSAEKGARLSKSDPTRPGTERLTLAFM